MKTPIYDFLLKNSYSTNIKAYMPGHKGLLNTHDITEIDGADSLYECEINKGIIYQSELNAQSLFNSKRTLYSTQGSTLSIQTMLMLLKLRFPDKNRIAAFRFAHRSFISAAVLLDFEIDWIYSDEFLSCSVSADDVKKAINDKTSGVFLNHFDYHGGKCDLFAIRDAIGDIPLLVDNAHGAYLVFENENHPNNFADLVCDSAHKTLPVLTGGGYLHINNEEFLPFSKEGMAILGSSSPSYLIMESLDLCNKFIYENYDKYHEVCNLIENFRQELSNLGFELVAARDKMKVVVKAYSYGYTGTALANELKARGLECEFADYNYTVLLFSIMNSRADFKKSLACFRNISKRISIAYQNIYSNSETSFLSPKDAFFSKSEIVSTKAALNRINAGIFSPCPPGVPLVMPGEIISEKVLDLLSCFGVQSIRVVCNK